MRIPKIVFEDKRINKKCILTVQFLVLYKNSVQKVSKCNNDI